jgi:preprotein translocase subunit Sss1
MLHWLRYGTPNEPVFMQALRLLVGLLLIGIVGSAIVFLFLVVAH